MPKVKVDPRYNVISVRVSSSEHDHLKKITLETNTTLSEIMREAVKSVLGKKVDVQQ